jgi:hypothetical protein
MMFGSLGDKQEDNIYMVRNAHGFKWLTVGSNSILCSDGDEPLISTTTGHSLNG